MEEKRATRSPEVEEYIKLRKAAQALAVWFECNHSREMYLNDDEEWQSFYDLPEYIEVIDTLNPTITVDQFSKNIDFYLTIAEHGACITITDEHGKPCASVCYPTVLKGPDD